MTGQLGKRTRGSNASLRVTIAGEQVRGKNAAEVFVSTICKLGIAQVEALGLMLPPVPLVSKSPSRSYQIRDGWYIATHSNTATKHSVLVEAARRLGRKDVVVELITSEDMRRRYRELLYE